MDPLLTTIITGAIGGMSVTVVALATYIVRLHQQRIVWLEAALEKAQAQTAQALTITQGESSMTSKLMHYVETMTANQDEMKKMLRAIERQVEELEGGGSDKRATDTTTRTRATGASGGR
jgi:chromosome condensin MukBEF ATPase and DNA-binding subunit MukB